MRRITISWVCSIALTACNMTDETEPRTLGEVSTGFNYIPVDALPVAIAVAPPLPETATASDMRTGRYRHCVARRAPEKKPADLMDALPDHTVRMAIRQMNGNGNMG